MRAGRLGSSHSILSSLVAASAGLALSIATLAVAFLEPLSARAAEPVQRVVRLGFVGPTRVQAVSPVTRILLRANEVIR